VASDSRPKRTRDAARTKQRLLDAARGRVRRVRHRRRQGRAIAAAARCNKALIYAYFDSKDALFDAAFAAHVQAHLDRVNFDGTDLPAYAGRLFDIFEDDPAVNRLASWYRLERSNGPGLLRDLREPDPAGKLRQAQSEGKLTDRWDANRNPRPRPIDRQRLGNN